MSFEFAYSLVVLNGFIVNFKCFITAICNVKFSINKLVLLLNTATILDVSADYLLQFIIIYKC